jgi:DNA-binding response OmpR family regulator
LLLPKGEEALTADRINVEPAEDIPLRERMLAALTKRQQLLMEHLWAKTTASFSVLQTIPNAWTSPDPSDDTVIKAIKRINTKLAENGLPVDLAIAGKRVNLNRPK